MHSVMGNHKTMTHQYTVNVQRSYTHTQGINSLYTTRSKVVKFLNSVIYFYKNRKLN